VQKRRERINERLRILQNLVPNGTKVNFWGKKVYIIHTNCESQEGGQLKLLFVVYCR